MPSKAFEGRHTKRGRVMKWSGNIFIPYWQVSVISATRAAAGLHVFALVDATLTCSLHDLIPLINLSQTPPGSGNPLTPARSAPRPPRTLIVT